MAHAPSHLSDTPLSGRDRIQAAIHHLEHLVPGQASIRDFVHHNTLHGFQHLDFASALTEARKYTGIYGYLSAERFRELFAEGRIDQEDLRAVIEADPALGALEPVGPTRRGEILLLKLQCGIKAITSRQLAWEIAEKGALERLQPGVSQESRDRLVVEEETEAVGGLWRACLESFGLSHRAGYGEQRLDLASEEDAPFSDETTRLTELESQREIIAAIRAEAARQWEGLVGRVGRDLTLGGLLRQVTGEDLLESIRPYLLRYLSGFLDLGVASWSLPDREAGFYLAWKRRAIQEKGQGLEELPDWEEHLADLPDDALETIEFCLKRLELPEARWGGYLERLALELPGWSGMVMWRSLRPGYGGSTALVRMADYLAVRLVTERLFALRLCRAIWLLEPTLGMLGWHFQRYRGEFFARHAFFSGSLPEFLATRASRLIHRPASDPDLPAEWRKLTWQIWTETDGLNGTRSHSSASASAWPLFVLCQHLGLTAEGIRALGGDGVHALMAVLESLDGEQEGFLWLRAYERHYRERIFVALRANRGRGRWAERVERPEAQVIFCMDDREEGIRRHLEEIAPGIETLGAAGFFGVPVNWRGLDDTALTPLCPVVVVPSHTVGEQTRPGHEPALRRHRRWLGLRGWWQRLTMRASHRGFIVPTLIAPVLAPLVWVSLFARGWFPEPFARLTGSVTENLDAHVPTEVTLTAPDADTPATPENPRAGFTLEEQAERVAGFLRTIGLTDGFAPIVAILGHGSSSQNNPHLAAYDCGACSGRHGGPNARLFAAMANNPEVRMRLRGMGIDIPEDCWFVGGEHNTGNEALFWFDRDRLPPAGEKALARLGPPLDAACLASAHERARRLASAPHDGSRERAHAHMRRRGVDFSQARPELGHATNAVALIGRRSVTRGVFFDRRMYLISYDPTRDADGGIVESILLAAGPVGAGISLEYYFSTVDNERFGCGTKVVHNITGLFGVMEGCASDLRTGLPRQMIEIHEAMRLLVIVEQRPEILTAIYLRQEAIRELVGNGWIELACIDPESGEIQHFIPGSGWRVWENTLPSPPYATSSSDWYQGHTEPLPPALIALPEESAHAVA
ncbi:MAG: DUF2309 domain-containing protein [Magnetococcales bacterium]|nr:DUF2309 domain-containing protein [Magnetococcales bacterium]